MDSSTPTDDQSAPHRHGVLPSCALTASAGSARSTVTNPYAKKKITRPPNPKEPSSIPTLPAAPGAASHPDGSHCAVRPRKRAWHSSHSYAENAPAPSASRQRPPRSEPVLHRGHDTTDPTSQKTGNTGRKLRGGKRKRQSTIITIPVGGTSASADAAADSKKRPSRSSGLPGVRSRSRQPDQHTKPYQEYQAPHQEAREPQKGPRESREGPSIPSAGRVAAFQRVPVHPPNPNRETQRRPPRNPLYIKHEPAPRSPPPGSRATRTVRIVSTDRHLRDELGADGVRPPPGDVHRAPRRTLRK